MNFLAKVSKETFALLYTIKENGHLIFNEGCIPLTEIQQLDPWLTAKHVFAIAADRFDIQYKDIDLRLQMGTENIRYQYVEKQYLMCRNTPTHDGYWAKDGIIQIAYDKNP